MIINKNKIIVITYDFFPDNSPNTYRWYNVLKSWKKHNLEIFVVTALKGNLLPYEEVDGIKIYRVSNSVLDNLKKNVAPAKSDVATQTIESSESSHEVSLIKKIYNLTWKKIYFPDFAFLWKKPAYKMASELIKEHKIYNVITVSWPFTDHVVGNLLKKKFAINWIADTIDPFYLSDAVNNRFLYKNRSKRLEAKTLSTADSISVLTPKLKQAYSELYPHLKNKISVNHNIFVPNPVFVEKKAKSHNEVFKFTFVGTLSKKTREPHLLLKFFTYLLDNNKSNIQYQLHFYGNYYQFTEDFQKFDKLLNKNIFLHGFIDRNKVVEVIQDSDVVVNIGNHNSYQEPSKVLEYVYMQKPILNVCSIKEDTTKELLQFYPHKFNVESDQIYNDELLENFHTFIEENKIINENYEKNIENYFLDAIEKKYFKLLKFHNE